MMNIPGDTLVELAREAVRAKLSGEQQKDAPQELLKDFAFPAGAFVTIRYATGALRGCVGTYRPYSETVVHEVIRVAPLAALSDPRFPPISLEELPSLQFEVSVLHELEPIESLEELDPSRYGLTLEDNHGHSGLLLPNIPFIDTPDIQFQEVCKKAGISPKTPVNMWRFEVDKYGPV